MSEQLGSSNVVRRPAGARFLDDKCRRDAAPAAARAVGFNTWRPTWVRVRYRLHGCYPTCHGVSP